MGVGYFRGPVNRFFISHQTDDISLKVSIIISSGKRQLCLAMCHLWREGRAWQGAQRERVFVGNLSNWPTSQKVGNIISINISIILSELRTDLRMFSKSSHWRPTWVQMNKWINNKYIGYIWDIKEVQRCAIFAGVFQWFMLDLGFMEIPLSNTKNKIYHIEIF